MFKKAFHIDNGETEMYEVDANTAIRQHPLEWSSKPWTEEAADKARSELAKRARANEVKVKPADPPAAKKYEAKHRGGGSYSIMGADGEVLDKLTKDDAELFNAGSEAEQEEFIKSELAKRG